MLSYSEVFSLLLALFMAPLIWRTSQGLDTTVRGLIAVALGCIVASYVFTIAEGYVFADLLNDLEHIFISASAVIFALGSYMLMRSSRDKG